jgi:O-antigen chain-terminating methyltransferase
MCSGLMFLRNNERIDTEILRNRVLLEIKRLKRQKTDGPAAAASLGKLVLASQKTPQRVDTEAKLPPAYIQFMRKISTWLWCFAHLPRIYTTADSTKSRLTSYEQQIGTHEQQIGTHEQQIGTHERQIGSLERELQRLELVLTDLKQSMLTDLEQRFTGLKREIMFQQRRLTRLGEIPLATTHARSDTIDHRLDAFYVAFENVFRGSREDIKVRMRPYLDRLMLSGAGQPSRPILDIGCGRGEWLEILKECHLQAYGIDTNVMMVERARSVGVDVQEADLITHLRDLPDSSRSAVTAFHVVEHLGFGVLVDFLDEALRVLMPGGMLILETPNPENLRVGANTFYNDPTHRNPIPPEPLRFLVDQRGFAEAEIVRLHPFPVEEHLRSNNEDSRRLNALLFGPQDYAIIARRP